MCWRPDAAARSSGQMLFRRRDDSIFAVFVVRRRRTGSGLLPGETGHAKCVMITGVPILF